MIIGKGDVIAWSWRQLRRRSLCEEDADGVLNGWATSEVGKMGWKMQEHWQFREPPTALLGLRHAEMRYH